jgi:hypothetical protein
MIKRHPTLFIKLLLITLLALILFFITRVPAEASEYGIGKGYFAFYF